MRQFGGSPQVKGLQRRRSWLGLGAVLLLIAGQASADASSRQATPEPPLFALERGLVSVSWRLAEQGRVEAMATLRGPRLRISRDSEAPAEPPPREPLPGPGEVAREASPVPLEVDYVAIHDGELVVANRAAPGELRIHQVATSIENFSTQRERSRGLPTLVSGSGRIGQDGRLAFFMTLNPWSEQLDFAGRVQIVGLRLDELGGFVENQTNLRPTSGTLALFIEFSVQDGQLTGGARPILTGADVEAAESDLWTELKSWVVSGAFELLADEVRGRERFATTIPLEGRVSQPSTDIWSAVWGVIENAFFDAINVGFQKLPPAS